MAIINFTGVPDKIEVDYTGGRRGYYSFKGTYIKAGWEVFGFPVYRKNSDKQRVFFQNLEGFWCFRYDGQTKAASVNEAFCHTKAPVKSGKFPFIPPETGWKAVLYGKGDQQFFSETMRVVSHW